MKRKLLSAIRCFFYWLIPIGMALWCIGAVYYSNLPEPWMRASAAIAFGLGLIILFARVRPLWMARLIFLAAFSGVVAWFLLIPPRNDRNWRPDGAVLPYTEIDGDIVTVRNIRNCDYRSETDYTVRHHDQTYDLAMLKSADLFLVYWGSPLIAHTMLSFGFEGGEYLCFSIEARRQKGEGYAPVKSLFRQFEITCVVADERDAVRLRTNYRGEQVYLYRVNADQALLRLVLLDYFNAINSLKTEPEWYNAVVVNCTTRIHQKSYPHLGKVRWNWRLLLNGYLDELAYSVGTLDRTLPFRELKARSLINERARAADQAPDFSARIREGLPGFSNDGRTGASSGVEKESR